MNMQTWAVVAFLAAGCRTTPTVTDAVAVRVTCQCCVSETCGGVTPPTDGGTPLPPEPPAGDGWLRTEGNAILRGDGARWQGKGVNLMDTRSCNACAYQPPDKAEVKRRADEAIAWGATFLRLDLESYASADGRVHWAPVTQDAAYLADIVDIVKHISSKGVYTEVSLWADPSIGAKGRPTAATADTWRVLAQAFLDEPRVIFGVINEPEDNYDGSADAEVWNGMNTVVQAIRDVETAAGKPSHLVAVQGTGGWARLTKYYITHPITAGGGKNVLYETHVYNPQSDFTNLVRTPAQTLPLIIGEFGPYPSLMTDADVQALMDLADSLKVPWLAWTFHMRCSPNLLVDRSSGGCGIGMQLEPTAFGNQVKAQLQKAKR